MKDVRTDEPEGRCSPSAGGTERCQRPIVPHRMGAAISGDTACPAFGRIRSG